MIYHTLMRKFFCTHISIDVIIISLLQFTDLVRFLIALSVVMMGKNLHT